MDRMLVTASSEIYSL